MNDSSNGNALSLVASTLIALSSALGSGCSDPDEHGIVVSGPPAIAIGAAPFFQVDDSCDGLSCANIYIREVKGVSSSDEEVAVVGAASQIGDTRVYAFEVAALASGSATVSATARLAGANADVEDILGFRVAEATSGTLVPECNFAVETFFGARDSTGITRLKLLDADGEVLSGEALDVSPGATLSDDTLVTLEHTIVESDAAVALTFNEYGSITLDHELATAPVTWEVYAGSDLFMETLLGDQLNNPEEQPIFIYLDVEGVEPCTLPGVLYATTLTPDVCRLRSFYGSLQGDLLDDVEVGFNGANYFVKAEAERTGLCEVEVGLEEARLSEVLSFQLTKEE